MEAMVHLVPSCVAIKNYQRLDFMFGSDLPIPSSHIKYAPKRPPWFSIGAQYSFWGPIKGVFNIRGMGLHHKILPPIWSIDRIWSPTSDLPGHEIEGFPNLSHDKFLGWPVGHVLWKCESTQITIDCCLYQMYPLHLSGHRSKVTQTCLMMKFMYIDHCCSYHGMACKN